MASLVATQDAITALIKTVKKANGYSYDLPDDHVYKVSNQNKINSQEAEDFPKIFVTLDSGTNQKQPARQLDRKRRWIITVYIKEVFVDDPDSPPVGWKPVADEIRDLVEDLENAFMKNITLGNVVDDLDVTNFETDADNAYPEGIIVMYVDTFDRDRV